MRRAKYWPCTCFISDEKVAIEIGPHDNPRYLLMSIDQARDIAEYILQLADTIERQNPRSQKPTS